MGREVPRTWPSERSVYFAHSEEVAMRRTRRGSRVVLFLLLLVPATDARAQVDLSGELAARLHEEVLLRRDPPGPSLGDYTGLPVNDAARLKADSWDASILSLRERQTIPSSAIYWAR